MWMEPMLTQQKPLQGRGKGMFCKKGEEKIYNYELALNDALAPYCSFAPEAPSAEAVLGLNSHSYYGFQR